MDEQAKEKFRKFKEDSINEYNKYLPYVKRYWFLILILIPLALSTYLRVQPTLLPVTDVWAQNTIYDSIRNEMSNQVKQQYPNLPSANKDIIINQKTDEFMKNNRDYIDQNINSLSEQFKSKLRDENGNSYLSAIDSYFWARHSRNVVNNGHPGDEVRDGKSFDNHMLAPLGRPMPPDMFHAYFGAYLFKIIHFFNNNVTLEQISFFAPIVLMGFSIIIAFFLGRILGGNIAGFFAATIIAINQSILVRTLGGLTDTDPYQLLFPLLITLVFFLAMNTQSKIKSFFYSLLTGVLMGFYSFAWGGWWYISFYIGGVLFIYLTFLFFNAIRKNEVKEIFKGTLFSRTLNISLVILISALASISVFSGLKEIAEIPFKASGFVAIHEISSTYVWPNVYITVAEQNEGSIPYAIDQVGGMAFYLFALFGLILFPLLKNNNSDISRKSSIILIIMVVLIWILTTTWAITRGVRFTLMLLPAFAVAFGVAMALFPLLIKKLFQLISIYNKQTEMFIQAVAVLIGLALIGLYPLSNMGMWGASKNIAFNYVTDLDDSWWMSLEKIKYNSTEDAIITSWWDFGHWFKYIADRPVTFDGTSQNNPQAHWVGKILATDNERYAIGILRMLDCGANTGFEKLDFHFNDIARTRDIIDPMFTMNRKEAYEYLKNISQSDAYGRGSSIGEEEANDILNYTHCSPPEAYFIASSDMVGKAGVWGHFGLWNFNKSLMYNELITSKYENKLGPSVNFLKTRFDLDEETAEKLFYEISSFNSKAANDWISTWPSYVNANNPCSEQENGTILLCSNNVKINLTEGQYSATINDRTVPYSLIYPTDSGTEEIIFDSEIPFSIVLYNARDGSKNYLLAYKDIANGMFTRMFFMNGHKLTYFEPFSYERSFSGNEVYIYKVNWDTLLEEEKNEE